MQLVRRSAWEWVKTAARRPRVVVLVLGFLALDAFAFSLPGWHGQLLFWLLTPVERAVVSREMRRSDERLLQQGQLPVSERRIVPKPDDKMPDAAVRLRRLRREQIACVLAGLALAPLAGWIVTSAWSQGDVWGVIAPLSVAALPFGLAVTVEVHRRAVRDSAAGRRVPVACRVLVFGEEPREVVLEPVHGTLAAGHRPLVADLPCRHVRQLALGDEVHVFGDFRPGRCVIVTTPAGSVWTERLRQASIAGTAAGQDRR